MGSGEDGDWEEGDLDDDDDDGDIHLLAPLSLMLFRGSLCIYNEYGDFYININLPARSSLRRSGGGDACNPGSLNFVITTILTIRIIIKCTILISTATCQADLHRLPDGAGDHPALDLHPSDFHHHLNQYSDHHLCHLCYYFRQFRL